MITSSHQEQPRLYVCCPAGIVSRAEASASHSGSSKNGPLGLFCVSFSVARVSRGMATPTMRHKPRQHFVFAEAPVFPESVARQSP